MLNDIDDFGVVVPSTVEAEAYVSCLQHTLEHLGLVEAKHKASPPAPSQVMT